MVQVSIDGLFHRKKEKCIGIYPCTRTLQSRILTLKSYESGTTEPTFRLLEMKGFLFFWVSSDISVYLLSGLQA